MAHARKERRSPLPADAPAKATAVASSAGPYVFPRRYSLLAALVLIVAGCTVYWNSMGGVFVFDDMHSIVKPAERGRLWPPSAIRQRGRALGVLTFGLNYRYGGLQPAGYHAVNTAVHVANALLVFLLARRLLRTRRLRERYSLAAATGIAGAGALLWVVHPLCTQAVTYVCQRYESLASFFYLLVVYSGVRAFQALEAPARRWPAGLWLGAATVSFAMGFATKQIIVTAPVVVILYYWIFCAESTMDFLKAKVFWVILVALVLFLGVMVVPRLEMLFAAAARAEYTNRTVLTYALSQPGAILHYLRLIFWPDRLCFDYFDWPEAHGIGDIWLPFLVIGALVGVATYGTLRRRPWAFAGVWFFGVLFVSSSVVPIADLVFEHRAYLAMAGVCVLLVAASWQGLAWCSAHGRPGLGRGLRAMAWLLLATAVAGCGVRTVRRNADYHSAINLWADTAAKRPDNPRAHFNLGALLKERGDVAAAERCFLRAIELSPEHAQAHNNLGNILLARGELTAAERHFRAALDKKGDDYPITLVNLGHIHTSRKQYDQAQFCFERALQRSPNNREATLGLAGVLQLRGKLEAAAKQYQRTLEIDPKFGPAYYNLALFHMRQKQFDQAEKYLVKLMEVEPLHAQGKVNLGTIYYARGEVSRAKPLFERAHELDPKLVEALVNLAAVALKESDPHKATAYYEEALRLNPANADAKHGLELVQKRLGRRAAADRPPTPAPAP